MSKETRRLLRYEREGYRYAQFDIEEMRYCDENTGERGERVIITVVMDKPTEVE